MIYGNYLESTGIASDTHKKDYEKNCKCEPLINMFYISILMSALQADIMMLCPFSLSVVRGSILSIDLFVHPGTCKIFCWITPISFQD